MKLYKRFLAILMVLVMISGMGSVQAFADSATASFSAIGSQPDFAETAYTVTYTDGVEDEEVFADQVYSNLAEGADTPTFDGEPTRSGYDFDSWNPDVANTVTKDETYTAQWKENEATISYVVDGEGGTVSLPDGEGAERQDEKVACKTGKPQGAVAKADEGWKFEKWTVGDQTVSTEATLTAESVDEYAKENGLFKDATFTAHFKQVQTKAMFYYAKSDDTLRENGQSGWGIMGDGLIDLKDAAFKNGSNLYIDHDHTRVIKWPDGFEGGEVSSTSTNFQTIFDAYQSALCKELGKDVTIGDVASIQLYPYKISFNPGDTTNPYHVDCGVEIKVNWDENRVTMHYVVADKEDGTVCWPGEDSADGNQQLKEMIAEGGSPKGAVATAGENWVFEKWTVGDAVIEEAKLTPELVEKYAKKDGEFQETTFTAHFKQVRTEAWFFFGLTPDAPQNLDSNEIGFWGNNNYQGIIKLEGMTFTGRNFNIQGKPEYIIEWPKEYPGGVVPKGTPAFDEVFLYWQSQLGKNVTQDDVEYIKLIPHKISYNPDDPSKPYHVDCGVEIKAHVYRAAFWLWDVGDTGYQTSAKKQVHRGETGYTVEKYPTLVSSKTGENSRPYNLKQSTDNPSGWYTDPELKNPATFPHEVTGNVDFYAKYIPVPAVTYDLNGGTLDSSEIATKYYSAGDEITVASAVPTREGHTFDNWTTKDVEIADGKFTMPDKDVTLQAQWTINSHTLTINYVDENGKELAPQVVETLSYNADYSKTSPTVTGYSLKNPAQATVSGTMPARDVTVNVVYTISSHKLSYQITGSYFKNDAYKVIENVGYGTALTLIPDNMEKEGYTWSGWSELPATMPDEDVVVTGSYTAENYRLHYNINGGIATDKPENKDTFHIGDSAQLSSQRPGHTETGVMFAGWTLDESAIGKIYKLGDAMPEITQKVTFVKAGDITVYAVWSYDEDGDHTPDVTQRPLTITGNSATVDYSGSPQEVTGYTSAGLDEGHEIRGLSHSVKASNAQATPYEGSFKTVGMQIVDASGKDVTKKYSVTTVPGTLTINPAPLTITTLDGSKTYDGTALTAEGTIEGLVDGEKEKVTFTVTGTLTNANQAGVDNSYTLDWGDVESGNYKINETIGKLTINPAPLTVTTPSATKLYDGAALTATAGASITGFVNGESATLTVTGTQTEPGSSDNTFSITWDNATESNYTLTPTLGTLTVEDAHRLTVLYLYTDGTPADDPYSVILPVGEAYSVESPAIEGFTANADFITGTMGNADVTWRVIYTANVADDPAPPVVVDTPDGPIEADPNPDGGIALDPGTYTLIPVNDEGTPLANLGLDGHVDCALHFLLILAAMLVVIAYTGSMKKHQKALQELTEKLELEKKRRGVSDGSGEKE